ncbi:hypothetical protein [Desulfovibrio sp. ZJ369]|uniref:hypothetical protein n=1 Tax=Desulfovibrio sp. ZJ369 TaxID=2709793 RepID=UPI0013EA8DC5|nr:hypothetical protein [Desulfovibrio sp. ZJ369]
MQNSDEYFAYAAAVTENRFVDLHYSREPAQIDRNGFLVRANAARTQLQEHARQPGEPVTTA